MKRSLKVLVVAGLIWFSAGCGGGGNGTDGPSTPLWTWMSGSQTVDQPGYYGALGAPGASNVPGARFLSISWVDVSGDLWLFGGGDGAGQFNDLWRYSAADGLWTWMSGSDAVDQSGYYGTLGAPGGTNVPGARWNSISWVDGSEDLWLFGGTGYDVAGSRKLLNDLWRYSMADDMWTWMSGSDAVDQPGYYGTLGAPAGSNIPGARVASISWVDGSGDMWLFSGLGWDGSGANGWLNDLWHYGP